MISVYLIDVWHKDVQPEVGGGVAFLGTAMSRHFPVSCSRRILSARVDVSSDPCVFVLPRVFNAYFAVDLV